MVVFLSLLMFKFFGHKIKQNNGHIIIQFSHPKVIHSLHHLLYSLLKTQAIIATNVTETSLTLDSIRYVVDCGYVKENHYYSKTGNLSLNVCSIAKAQAIQRKGRVGRTAPGKCFRLYTEEKYEYDRIFQKFFKKHVNLDI